MEMRLLCPMEGPTGSTHLLLTETEKGESTLPVLHIMDIVQSMPRLRMMMRRREKKIINDHAGVVLLLPFSLLAFRSVDLFYYMFCYPNNEFHKAIIVVHAIA